MSTRDFIAARTPLGAITAVSAVAREESQAAGLIFIGSAVALMVATVLGLGAVGVLAALEAREQVESETAPSDRRAHTSNAPTPYLPSAAVASLSALPSNVDAASSDGDDRPVALAPEVARELPASHVATQVPRVGDGPPEGPLEER